MFALVTQPRQVVPGRCYLITRRVAERRFLLRPDATTKQVVLYCIARAAQRYGVELHALQVLSNHYHLVATDTRGELPDFIVESPSPIPSSLSFRSSLRS